MPAPSLFNRMNYTMISTLLAASFLVPVSTVVEPDTNVNPIAVEPYQMTWQCEDCSENEKKTLAYLQEKANITDKNALVTILGNIRQESNFIANICEGGARVRYDDCHRGGYGIIQWTSVNRYDNLGRFGQRYNCDPLHSTVNFVTWLTRMSFRDTSPSFKVGDGLSHNTWCLHTIGWDGASKVIVKCMHTTI